MQWFASTEIVWELVVVAVICDIIHLIIGCVVSVFCFVVLLYFCTVFRLGFVCGRGDL